MSAWPPDPSGVCIALFTRMHRGGAQIPPEARPVGRAALKLLDEGITVLVGDSFQAGRGDGFVAAPGRWLPVHGVPIQAVHDRFPSQTWPQHYRAVLAQLGHLPMGNPTAATLLCRDKLRSQRLLERWGLAMPQVEQDFTRFRERLSQWGAGFLKPRFGALGRGISRVEHGRQLHARGEGAVKGVEEPMLLQRAVPPPRGWAGWSVRMLMQRLPGGAWMRVSRVLRRSRTDPVVNVARGAEVLSASSELSVGTLDALDRLSHRVCDAVANVSSGHLVLELGVDAVIDVDGQPVLIEVNSRPRGRLEALAALDPSRYQAAHIEACARPFRYLAHIARSL